MWDSIGSWARVWAFHNGEGADNFYLTTPSDSSYYLSLINYVGSTNYGTLSTSSFISTGTW